MLVAIRDEYRVRFAERRAFRSFPIIEAETRLAICIFYIGRPALPSLPAGTDERSRLQRQAIVEAVARDAGEEIPYEDVSDYWEAIERFGEEFTEEVLLGGDHQLAYLASSYITDWSHFRNTLAMQIRRFHVRLAQRLPQRRANRLARRSELLLEALGYASNGQGSDPIFTRGISATSIGRWDNEESRQVDDFGTREFVQSLTGLSSQLLLVPQLAAPTNPNELPAIYSDDKLIQVVAIIAARLPSLRRSDLQSLFRPLVAKWYAVHGRGLPDSMDGALSDLDWEGREYDHLPPDPYELEARYAEVARDAALRFIKTIDEDISKPEEVKEQLRLMLESHDITSIAEAVGRSRRTVYDRIDALRPILIDALSTVPEDGLATFGWELEGLLADGEAKHAVCRVVESLDATDRQLFILLALRGTHTRANIRGDRARVLADMFRVDQRIVGRWLRGLGPTDEDAQEMLGLNVRELELRRERILDALARASCTGGDHASKVILGRVFTVLLSDILSREGWTDQ